MFLRLFIIAFLATLGRFIIAQKQSPCPDVLTFEPRGSEEDRWYGVISLTTTEQLNGVWIQLGLDRPAELLGNWFADATSFDNIKYIIRNPSHTLNPGEDPLRLRFFVKYNTAQPIPSIDYIRLNGRTICSAGTPTVTSTTEKLHISQFVGNRTQSRPSSTSGGSFLNNPNKGTTQNQGSSGSGTNTLSTGEDSSSSSDVFPGDFLVLQPNRPQTTTNNVLGNRKVGCGVVGVSAKPLIAYGQDTTPGQWPWHAALFHVHGVTQRYNCGGTLISESHVLTAAHCVTRPQTNRVIPRTSVIVILGKYSLKVTDEKTQTREVDQIYVHPDYNATVYFNDLAILKLDAPVVITKYVRTCCLWEGDTELEPIINQLGTVIGWGFDENREVHDTLLQAKVPVVSPLKCIYSNREFFSQFTFENNFCAGFTNGTTVCNGDSGGGLVFPKKGSNSQNPVWQLRGVVSVGVALQGLASCDTSNYAVFTDTAKYGPWIQGILSR